jgi:4-hydroxy-tetrahydrodipicolinate reductase
MRQDDIRIGVAGAGRMGQAVQRVIAAADGVCVASVWRRGEALDAIVADADVLIDFSLPAATAEVLAAVVRHRRPLVCGVSGLDAAQMESLRQAAGEIPIVFDRNMSQGISVLTDLVSRAAGSLGPEFGVVIHEVHHVHKKDAPSGTALQLGESIDAARAAFASADAIRYDVERRGEVPGEHTVILSSPTETLTLQHSVTDRAVFAEGALRAARWVILQKPGLYRMRDVLFVGTE